MDLAGFIEKADDFFAKGVDSILCLSVNDAFVMSAWGKSLGAEGKVSPAVIIVHRLERTGADAKGTGRGVACVAQVMMLADGGADFTTKTGLQFETGNFGGCRLQRMSMLVSDWTGKCPLLRAVVGKSRRPSDGALGRWRTGL
jgi:glutaredoxin/glutathione-dependent peroxiredoxin